MAKEKSVIPIERIAAQIYVIRGESVMLDADLAELYHVETGTLVRAMKRNLDRFPEDFAFQLALLHESLRHVRLSPMGQGASMRNDAESIHVPVPSTQLVRLQSGADIEVGVSS